MKRHWAYLKYVLRHKWYVFLAARELGIAWLGVIHDWSKFLPGEFVPYAEHFYTADGKAKKEKEDETGYYKATYTGENAFDFAWLLHQKRNRHHWQWWVLPEDEGGLKILPIPGRYRREMLADWRGAGRAQGKPDTLAWYMRNKDKIQLHPDTRQWIEQQLDYRP